MSRRATAAAIALAIALFLAVRHKAVPGYRAPDRPLAPAFSVVTLDGRHLTLSDYRGKIVLVDFWATWCGPCRKEIPALTELQKKYGPYGFQIIGISLDDNPKPVRQFYARFKMNYPVALGNARLAESFGGILGLPVAFLIDRDGRLRAKHVGQTDVVVFEKEIRGMLRPVAAKRARLRAKRLSILSRVSSANALNIRSAGVFIYAYAYIIGEIRQKRKGRRSFMGARLGRHNIPHAAFSPV
jgi:thiol-disulfide isomerase/thioredoxin